MSVRDKRIEALREKHPNKSDKELRKLARKGSHKASKKRPARTRKMRRDRRRVARQ